ncbi:MAG: class I tRNA ligase family protein [Candidatus Pacebacteria bacterium]|nr:class I tRNA ligase family protein [Candidatus Paceibacterota bacterium]
MPHYDPKEIEAKWNKKWLDEKVFAAHDDSKKPKYYQLETFPYPSAAGLHMGHPKGYTAEDIHARYMRMRGYEVLYTMGWDAFGLPTENYAIKVGKNPKEVALANTTNFRRQVQMFGFSYDWDREVDTSSPEYYKWTQWLFIRLYKKGLAYRKDARVNWCPKDQTVLANEQVIDGKCERCGSEIEERMMEQWFLKITDYADRLLADLKGIDWPAATIKRQEDWIGKSEGASIKFQIANPKSEINPKDQTPSSDLSIEIFTTRPDTLFGATYLVLAPEHSLIGQLKEKVGNWDEVAKYVEETTHKTDRMRQETAKEKTGVELKGVMAVNPATKEEIPIWVADYVLGSYGTGAIMAVPAHDERDFEFAKKFGIPIREVVAQETGIKHDGEERRDGGCGVIFDPATQKYAVATHPDGLVRLFAGGVEDGENMKEGVLREIAEESGLYDFVSFEKVRTCFTHYHNSRKQVYRSALATCFLGILASGKQKERKLEEHEKAMELAWMTPKEILENWNTHNNEHDLDHWFIFFREAVARAIELGYDKASNADDFRAEIFSGTGVLVNSGEFSGMDSEKAKAEIVKSVGGTMRTQYKIRDWSVSRQRYWGVPIPMIHCSKCGIVPVPESDLPVLLPDLENYRPQGMPPLASSAAFINVKCPQCGGDAKRDAETLDTFVDSSWYFLRYPDPHNDAAIFDKQKVAHWMPVDLYVIGAEHTVMHLLYSRFITKFLHDEGYVQFTEPFKKLRHIGLIMGADGQKMSKSKGNVVNPDEIVAEFSADVMRMYLMFLGPFDDATPWDAKGILGVERFLKRFWNYCNGAREKAATGAPTAAEGSPAKQTLHRAIKRTGEDIEAFKFNTAISGLMIALNELEAAPEPLAPGDGASLVKLLHPLAPHMAQELWSLMGNTTYLDFEPWPEYDPKLIVQSTLRIAVQVNGKTRDTLTVAAGITEDEAKKAALGSAKVQAALGGQAPKRVIWVENKLVNIVA